MMTLYMRPTCPFCQKVLKRAEELGVTFELKDINNPVNAAELVAQGGKQQVPYLVDAERGAALYESADIIGYIEHHDAKR